MSAEKRDSWLVRPYVCSALVAGIVLAFSLLVQKPFTYNGGLGWDGSYYTQLAAQCGRSRMTANEPFVYRIGAPCLAALLPLPPKTALWAINIASSILLIFLLEAWLRQHVRADIVPLLIAGFAFHWVAPPRQVWWYPTYIDPLALCAIVAALLLRPGPTRGTRAWVGNRVALFAIVCFAGTLVRETTIVVPLALLAGAVVGGRRDGNLVIPGAAGLIACAAAIALARLLVTPATDYWMADAALYWAYEKALPSFVLALFIAFGPALVLLAVRPAPVMRYLREFPEYAALLIIVLALAWIGGSDTERFLLWASPVVLVLLGRAAAEIDWRRFKGPAALLLVTAATNGRWFLATPDYVEHAPRPWPVLTPWTAQSSAFLYSQHADRVYSTVVLGEYLVLLCVLFALFRRQPR
jgi:hypothetical protein